MEQKIVARLWEKARAQGKTQGVLARRWCPMIDHLAKNPASKTR